MTLLKLFSPSTLNKKEMEIVEKFPQQFEEILSNYNVKSKKKRIQKKVMKAALLQLTIETSTDAVTELTSATETKVVPIGKVVMETNSKSESTVSTKETEVKNVAAKDVTDSFNFEKLPVKFLLSTGKKFFENEKVFRFYYNQNHPEFYKNKELLLAQFKELTLNADSSLKSELLPLIKGQLSS